MSSIKPDSFQFSVKVGQPLQECCISLMRLALTVWSLTFKLVIYPKIEMNLLLLSDVTS